MKVVVKEVVREVVVEETEVGRVGEREEKIDSERGTKERSSGTRGEHSSEK